MKQQLSAATIRSFRAMHVDSMFNGMPGGRNSADILVPSTITVPIGDSGGWCAGVVDDDVLVFPWAACNALMLCVEAEPWAAFSPPWVEVLLLILCMLPREDGFAGEDSLPRPPLWSEVSRFVRLPPAPAMLALLCKKKKEM